MHGLTNKDLCCKQRSWLELASLPGLMATPTCRIDAKILYVARSGAVPFAADGALELPPRGRSARSRMRRRGTRPPHPGEPHLGRDRPRRWPPRGPRLPCAPTRPPTRCAKARRSSSTAASTRPTGRRRRSPSGFLQRDPDQGQPATEPTELRLLFDDHALYVGARLRDSEPGEDRPPALAARRARGGGHLHALPRPAPRPAHRGRPAGERRRRAAGRRDLRRQLRGRHLGRGLGVGGERSTGTAGASRCGCPSRSCASRRPPATPGASTHAASCYRKNESSWLVLVPKNESGLASRMTGLEGIGGIEPGRHLELLPYVSGRAEFIAPAREADPWNDGSRLYGGAGLDFKYGVGSGMALVGAVNPDFGQVEVDPAVVNLSAFETFFEEKRPFFTEGSQVFLRFGRSGASEYTTFFYPEPQLFYSRRIGRAPQDRASGEFVDTPTATTILGAAKLVGRTKSGWNLGLLEAVTGREYARLATGDRAPRGRGRAPHELLRGPRPARPGPARVDRLPGHRRHPRPRDAQPRQPPRRPRARGRSRRPRPPGREARHRRLRGSLGEHGRGKPGLGPARPAGGAAVLPAARRPARERRPHGDVPLGLERAARPEQEQRQRDLQRRPLGDQPRLRAERHRLRHPDRPRRRPRPGRLPEARPGRVDAQPAAVGREVVDLQLRPRVPGRRSAGGLRRAAPELLAARLRSREVLEHLGRQAHARRADHDPTRDREPERRGRERLPPALLGLRAGRSLEPRVRRPQPAVLGDPQPAAVDGTHPLGDAHVPPLPHHRAVPRPRSPTRPPPRPTTAATSSASWSRPSGRSPCA